MKAGYNKQDLQDLGRGALFHDVGKRKVPAEVICKKGGLDESEWAIMKRHPLFGLQILNEFPDINDNIKACVFEHHENHIGNGYPQGLKGEDIHPMARIVALTDTYDALTTKRSYNVPMSPAEALTLMKEKLAGRFDPKLLETMYAVLFKIKK
jgi:HD-GYP domain-containing protein (c-di-GMP phosphodiesterase class II)